MELNPGQQSRPVRVAAEYVQRIGGSVIGALSSRGYSEQLIEQSERNALHNALARKAIVEQLGEPQEVEEQIKAVAYVHAVSLDRRLQKEESVVGDRKFADFLEAMNELPPAERNFKQIGLDDEQIARLSEYPVLRTWFIEAE